jgi:hypothetical protein
MTPHRFSLPWVRKKKTVINATSIDVNALHEEIVNLKQKIRYIEKWMTTAQADLEYEKKQRLIKSIGLA